MKYLTHVCWIGVLTTTACGGSQDSVQDSKIIQNLSGSKQDPASPVENPNEINLSKNLSLGIGETAAVEIPEDYQGFCHGELPADQLWSMNDSAGSQVNLNLENPCTPQVTLLSGYTDSIQGIVTLILPLPNSKVLKFETKLHLRKPPEITAPAIPTDIHPQITNFTGPDTSSPPFASGPNFNGDGEKMRFCSPSITNPPTPGVYRWFRDGNKSQNRHFGIPIILNDPSIYNPSTNDIALSLSCSGGPFRPELQGCETYCPFTVTKVTIGSQIFAKITFKGQTTSLMNPNGFNQSIFLIESGQCIDNDSGTIPVTINLTASNQGGQTTKSLMIMKMEVDGCFPY